MLVPIVSLIITIAGLALAFWIKSRNYAASGTGLVLQRNHIGLRLIGGVSAPEGIEEAMDSIDAVLSQRFGKWWEKIDLVIEWLPYNTVVLGPFIKTGYHVRGTDKAAMPPKGPPFEAGIEKVLSRVGGTIRINKSSPLPWGGAVRYTAMIMDRRVGESPRSFLIGDGAELPRASAKKTPLFYEVCWRVVPMGLMGVLAGAIPKGATTYRELELAMEAEYDSRKKPA